DPTGSFTGMDFEDAVAAPDAFDLGHAHMSTSPTSNFVQNVVIGRRDSTGVDKLANQTLRRTDGNGVTEWTLSCADEYFGAVADVFDLDLSDLDADDRARLWHRAQAGQAAYEASRDAAASPPVLPDRPAPPSQPSRPAIPERPASPSRPASPEATSVAG